MRTVDEPAAHYRAVIADLRAKLDRLTTAAAEAEQVAKSKAKAVADCGQVIAVLEAEADELGRESGYTTANSAAEAPNKTPDTEPSAGSHQPSAATADFLVNLALGDACIAMLRRLSGSASTREIADALHSHGYRINSKNPVNNVGACLNHRTNSKGDVARSGRSWILLPPKGGTAPMPQTTELAAPTSVSLQ